MHELGPDFILVGKLDDFEKDVPTAVVINGKNPVCLIRSNDQVWAIQDSCPHKGFILSGGECFYSESNTLHIECPWHGAVFSCQDGSVVSGPTEEALKTYQTRIVDSNIYIEIPYIKHGSIQV